MITRSELAGSPAKAFDKAYGALSDLVIGDSLGDAARKPEDRASYGITTDLNKGTSWSTNDTEFALLAAKALIGCGENPTSDIVVRAWSEDVTVQDEFKCDGTSEIGAANSLCKKIRPPLSGKYNAFHMSDGSVMRIGPVDVICASNPKRAVAMAEIDASVSRYHDGIWGTQAVAVAVSMAIVGATVEEIFDTIMKVVPEESWLHHAMNHAFEIVDDANGSILDVWTPLHDELYTSNWATAAEILPSAFAYLRMRNEAFREGVILAANFARDVDAIGAMARTVLGAKHDVSSIPAHWVKKTRYPIGTYLRFTNGLDTKEVAGELAKPID